MSFRRDKQRSLRWQQWIKSNQDCLIASGVPREIWEDELTWWRFVEHGHHPAGDNARDIYFYVEQLSEPQQRRLFELLRGTFQESERKGPLWGILNTQFGHCDDEAAS